MSTTASLTALKRANGRRLRVLFITSELSGLVKTGGLGDVAKALPQALVKQGVDLRVVMPYYSALIKPAAKQLIASLIVKPGQFSIGCSIYYIKQDGVVIYLVDHKNYFHRPRLYDDGLNEYQDNPQRFSLLCTAALQLALKIRFIPDCVHCNDWQAALAPWYLQQLKKYHPELQPTKTVLTVHNGSFQGKYAAAYCNFLGLAEAFHSAAYEEFGYINLLKGGIFYADQVNAVSPGYAKELLTVEGGHGLEQAYQRKGASFSGILNGCDYSIWNPKTDPHIAQNYWRQNLAGKRFCKQDLLKQFGLKLADDLPVIGMISRLTAQKGFHFTLPALYELAKMNICLIILGDGDQDIAAGLNHLRSSYPDKVGFHQGYDEVLAHKIEAGSDFFLMPSLFEPCGLNQMYSQRYGTLPVVRLVGGLGDTVHNYGRHPQRKNSGFVFSLPTADAVINTLVWALSVYKEQPQEFSRLISVAMGKRYSWNIVAKKYQGLYLK